MKRPAGGPASRGRSLGAAKDLVGSTGLVRSVVFSRDGSFLISVTTPPNDDQEPGEIRLWDTQDFKSRQPIKLNGDPFAMAVSRDNKTLAVAISRDEEGPGVRSAGIRVIALPSGETKKEWPLEKGVDVWSLVFAADGKSLYGGTGGLGEGQFFGEVRIWDHLFGEERLRLKGHPNPVMSLAVSHDGRTLASASGTYGAPRGEVRLWDRESGRLLQTLIEADEAIVTVAFSPDDKTVASGGTIWRDGNVVGGVVTLWDTATGARTENTAGLPVLRSRGRVCSVRRLAGDRGCWS